MLSDECSSLLSSILRVRSPSMSSLTCKEGKEGGQEDGREGERVAGREGGREGGRVGGWQGGREGGREVHLVWG